MSDVFVIDFNKFEGPVFSGRERGERLRAELELDILDKKEDHVKVVIPENTYSVTSSFFLGLFGLSVIQAGSRENFYNKFVFNAPDYIMEDVEGYVSRALAGNVSLN